LSGPPWDAAFAVPGQATGAAEQFVTVPTCCQDRLVADEQRRRLRGRIVVVVASLTYAVVVAEAVAAAWSLLSGDRWDWERFWRFFITTLVVAGASNAAEALARRGFFGSLNPEKQRKLDEDEELARALRTGLPPTDADPAQWRARIRRDFKQGVAIATASTFLCLTAAALTATAAHVSDQDETALWVLAVVSLLAPAPLLRLVARIRRNAERLEARL
jgi:hypothetical protein